MNMHLLSLPTSPFPLPHEHPFGHSHSIIIPFPTGNPPFQRNPRCDKCRQNTLGTLSGSKNGWKSKKRVEVLKGGMFIVCGCASIFRQCLDAWRIKLFSNRSLFVSPLPFPLLLISIPPILLLPPQLMMKKPLIPRLRRDGRIPRCHGQRPQRHGRCSRRRGAPMRDAEEGG